MKVLAINGSYRPEHSTTQFVQAALDGAASLGAETEMVMLRDKNIGFCTNCLACYRNLEPRIPRCKLSDDMDPILDQLWQADAVLFASPVHCGFVTALMTTFFERAIWRLCRPTGGVLTLKGFPAPRSDKIRALATIVSAGGVPDSLPKALKKLDDLGSPWMKSNGGTMLNGRSVGELFAGAVFPQKMSSADWSRAYCLRRLTDEQLASARTLGVKLARTVQSGAVLPHDYWLELAAQLGPVGEWTVGRLSALRRRLRR